MFKFYTTDVVGKGLFSTNPDKEPEKIALHPKLRSMLTRLYQKYDDEAAANENLFIVPKLNSAIDLRTQATLFALVERITAGESLVFFETVLRSVRDKLEKLTPPQKKDFLSHFYSQTVDVIAELRTFIYQCAARRLIDVWTSHPFCLFKPRF